MLFFGNQTAAEQAPVGADEVIGHGASVNIDCGLKAAIALWPRLLCQKCWDLAFARIICAKMLASFLRGKLCQPAISRAGGQSPFLSGIIHMVPDQI